MCVCARACECFPTSHAYIGIPVLSCERASTPGDIKKSFKKMSLEFHPDKNPSADAAVKFTAIKEAYDVLMDTNESEELWESYTLGLAAEKPPTQSASMETELYGDYLL